MNKNSMEFSRWSFGNKIKTIRKHKKYTQKYCALNCQVSVVTWQNWESGVTEPNGGNMAKIKNLFEIKDGNM